MLPSCDLNFVQPEEKSKHPNLFVKKYEHEIYIAVRSSASDLSLDSKYFQSVGNGNRQGRREVEQRRSSCRDVAVKRHGWQFCLLKQRITKYKARINTSTTLNLEFQKKEQM